MTATINYDKHIVNLIDELSRTGHVTHTKYKKKSVTLHHNGGVRFSHQTILNIWRTRPASAHFDVDANGAVAQYVEAHEYAWAVGNTQGNCETISIEMADISAGPQWAVAEDTWRSAARLAGWLFAHVVGARPTRNNFFYHHHWSQTACAGPFMDKIYGQVLAAAQEAYDHFHGAASPTPAPTPAPAASPVSAIQRAVEVPVDGKWGPATDFRVRLMRAACLRHLGYPNNTGVSFDIRTAQRIVDSTPDGVWGPITQDKLVAWLKGFQRILGVTPDGRWGPATEGRFSQVRNKYLIR